jgi:hypothetical protein
MFVQSSEIQFFNISTRKVFCYFRDMKIIETIGTMFLFAILVLIIAFIVASVLRTIIGRFVKRSLT